jgi:hypothetical protein
MTIATTLQPSQGHVADPAIPLKGWRPKLLRYVLLGRGANVGPAQLKEFLEYFDQGDPLADAVIAMYQELPAGEGRKLTERALNEGIAAIPDAPEPLVSFFRHVETVPSWIDQQQLQKGADVMMRTGPFADLVLRNLSLTSGYLSAAASKPLMFTGQLDRMTPRRLIETARFWVDVHKVNGMSRFGDGFKSAVHVRLMHAQVRHMINKSGRWNQAEWGQPINQAAMMYTILEFSQILLLGLRALGFRFTLAEREAVIHHWRYIGYLSGVHEHLLPENEQQAKQALWMQYLTFFGLLDDDTRALGQAVHGVPMQRAANSPIGKGLARLESSYRAAYSRLLLGPQNGDALGLPKTPVGTLAVLATFPAIFSLETARRSIPGSTKALAVLGRRIIGDALSQTLKVEAIRADFVAVNKLAR